MFRNFINADNLLFCAGITASFLSAMLRSARMKSFFTKRGFFRAVCDALTCSLFSCGVIMATHSFFGDKYEYAILIGTFIGSIGSTYTTQVILALGKKIFKITDGETK